MSGIPTLPSESEIRSAMDSALKEVGFKRVRGAGYVRQIDDDFSLSVIPHGGTASQSANIGAIYKPACIVGIEIWDQIRRHWIKGRRDFIEGMPAEHTTFCTGPVLDRRGLQRSWVFCGIPHADEPVSLEEFAADLAALALKHVRDNPDVRTALANPDMRFTVPYELRPTVHAMLGDEEGFTRTAQPALVHMETIKRIVEEQKATIAPEFMPDFAAYFEAVRARFLTV